MPGFVAVGDAHTCTNPLYGRGCSLALVQAIRLGTALAAHPDDLVAVARDYEAASGARGRAVVRVRGPDGPHGRGPGGIPAALADGGAAGKAMAAVFAAGATDPVIGRGLMRLWNLLATTEDLMADPVFLGRVMEVMADPDAYPTPPREGPARRELLAALAEEAA